MMKFSAGRAVAVPGAGLRPTNKPHATGPSEMKLAVIDPAPTAGQPAVPPMSAGRVTPANSCDPPKKRARKHACLEQLEIGAAVAVALTPLPVPRRPVTRSSLVKPAIGWASAPARPRPGYMAQQQHVSYYLRAALVDWLVEVCEVYRFRPHTLFLAVGYVDRFLSVMNVRSAMLQLAGITCMMIAAKYEEISPPSSEDFAYITDSTYTVDQILKMECAILNALKFDMSLDSPLIYTDKLIEAVQGGGGGGGADKRGGREGVVGDVARSDLAELTVYLALLTMMDAEVYLKADARAIAAAAVVVALDCLGEASWTDRLAAAVKATGLSEEALDVTVNDLRVTTESKGRTKLALHEKFCKKEHGGVAKLV